MTKTTNQAIDLINRKIEQLDDLGDTLEGCGHSEWAGVAYNAAELMVEQRNELTEQSYARALGYV